MLPIGQLCQLVTDGKAKSESDLKKMLLLIKGKIIFFKKKLPDKIIDKTTESLNASIDSSIEISYDKSNFYFS